MGRKRFKTTADPLLCEDAEILELDKNRCANCSKSLHSMDKIDYVVSSLASSYAKVTIADAISVVFEMAKKLNPTVLVDNNDTEYLAMCYDCHSIFNELFNSYKKFLKLTNSKSYIRSCVRNCIVWNENEIPVDILPAINEESQEHDLDHIDVQFEVIKREDHGQLVSNNGPETVASDCNILPDTDLLCTTINDLGRQDDELTPLTSVVYTEKFPLIRVEQLSIEEVNSANNWNYFLEQGLEHKKLIEQSNLTGTCLERTCHLCERKFPKRKLAKSHIEVAHKNIFKPFSCQWCNERFAHSWFHKHHVEIVHSGIEMQFMCKICNAVYKTSNELNYHKSVIHHEKYPFGCNYCEDGYKEIEELRDHLLDKHSNSKEAKTAAENRKYISENPFSYKLGEELKSSEPIKCPICKIEFKDALSRDKHVRYSHEKRTECVFCDKVFLKVVDCRRHETEVHDSYKCPKCDKNFATLMRLDRHMKAVHVTYKTSICEACGKSYPSLNHLNSHYKWHITTALPPKFVCPLCQKPFSLKNSLNCHIKFFHDKQRPTYKCLKCSKTYYAKSLLQQHNERFHGLKSSHKCLSCDRTFPTSKRLILHSRSHRDVPFRPKLPQYGEGQFDIMACYSEEHSCFVCSICDSQVRRKDHFIRHVQRQHTCVKHVPAQSVNFRTCETCDKTFESKEEFTEHLSTQGHKAWISKTHLSLNKSQIEAYECDLCGKFYKGKYHFQKHLRTLHKPKRTIKRKNSKIKNEIIKNESSESESDN